jgi:hypothetical protein
MSWLYHFAAVIALATAAGELSAGSARAETPCDYGTLVRADKCSFFDYFKKDDAYLDKDGAHPDDVRVKVLLRHLGAKEGDHIRSIALIAGISNYPKLPQDEQSLDAAKIDIDKLEILLKDQKFDEIIVLRDGDVTLENLRYFLRTYALRQADYYKKKLRFLFAYSGHGVEVDRTSSKGLLLAQASSAEDLDNVIGMNELQPYFNDLATSTFHFLALVNSCYGGAIFTVGVQGDDRGNTYSEGAYAITAGPADKKVYSIAAGHGSFFFESLIQGVATGDADNQNKINNLDDSKDSSEPGSTKGTIRLSMLETYLENIIQKQNDRWRELKTSNRRFEKRR